MPPSRAKGQETVLVMSGIGTELYFVQLRDCYAIPPKTPTQSNLSYTSDNKSLRKVSVRRCIEFVCSWVGLRIPKTTNGLYRPKNVKNWR